MYICARRRIFIGIYIWRVGIYKARRRTYYRDIYLAGCLASIRRVGICMYMYIYTTCSNTRMSQWKCPLCLSIFVGKRSRNCHEQNLMKSATDPSRCDNVLQRYRQAPVPIIPNDRLDPPQDDCVHPVQEPAVVIPAAEAAPAENPTRVVLPAAEAAPAENPRRVIDPLIARRPPVNEAGDLYVEKTVELVMRPESSVGVVPRDLTVVQENWKRSGTLSLILTHSLSVTVSLSLSHAQTQTHGMGVTAVFILGCNSRFQNDCNSRLHNRL